MNFSDLESSQAEESDDEPLSPNDEDHASSPLPIKSFCKNEIHTSKGNTEICMTLL